MFIPELNSKCVFKYPLMVVKNCHQQNVLKETTLRFFACLATADSFSISFFASQPKAQD